MAVNGNRNENANARNANARNANARNWNENEAERIDRLAEMERNRRNGGRRKRVTKKNKKQQQMQQKGGDIDHVLHKLDVSTVTCNRVFKKK
jgi:hypothetical protein